MEQRPLRLGDIVDDYCPRERRVTNHAIVAIVGDSVRQTRCSTCDAEHEFKGARMPKKKSKSSAGEPAGVLVTPPATAAEPVAVVEMATAVTAVIVDNHQAAPSVPEEPPVPQNDLSHDGWAAHRRLIRATLPRVEGSEPPARPIPEFTMHQRQPRGFQGRGFRHGHGSGAGGPHANGFRSNQNHGSGNPFREGDPDGNRVPPPGGGKAGAPGAPGAAGRRRRRRRR